MKRFSVILFVVFAVLFAVNARAQVRFGVTGGMLVNKVSFKGVNDNADNYTGWYVGPTLEVGIPLTGLKVDGSLLYTKNGAKFGNESICADYVSVPLNLKMVMGMSSLAAIYLSAGPQFDYCVGDSNVKDFSFKKNQLSFNVGAGVRLLSHLQVGAYYNIPTGNTADSGLVFKNNMWKVNLLVLF